MFLICRLIWTRISSYNNELNNLYKKYVKHNEIIRNIYTFSSDLKIFSSITSIKLYN